MLQIYCALLLSIFTDCIKEGDFLCWCDLCLHLSLAFIRDVFGNVSLDVPFFEFYVLVFSSASITLKLLFKEEIFWKGFC